MGTTRVFYSEKLNKLLVIIVLLLFPLLIAVVASQQKTHTVSGSCYVQDSGVLYIYLVDAETFKKPMTGLQKIVQKVTLEANHPGKIPFSFNGVNTGVYGVRCFIDKDGNGKLNRGFLGPSEPWGMSSRERPRGMPSFSDISFKVDKSVENIIIRVK